MFESSLCVCELNVNARVRLFACANAPEGVYRLALERSGQACQPKGSSLASSACHAVVRTACLLLSQKHEPL